MEAKHLDRRGIASADAYERSLTLEEKLLKITDTFSIHVPAGMSPEAEARLVARLRDGLDNPERSEAEFRELLQLDERGETFELRDVLAELGIEVPDSEGEPA